MFSKKSIIELNRDKIDCYIVNTTKKNCKLSETNLDRALKLKNKYIIIKNEEFLVKYIEIPPVKDNILKNLIQVEIQNSYGAIDEFLYDYKLIDRTKEKMRVMIICISSRNLNKIENNTINKIKHISIIQQYFIKYINSQVREKNYVAVIEYENIVYIIIYENGNINYSNTINYDKFSSNNNLVFQDVYEYFMENEIIHNSVYTVNIGSISIPLFLKKFIEIKSLGVVTKQELIHCYLNKKSMKSHYNLLPKWYRDFLFKEKEKIRARIIIVLIFFNIITISYYTITNNNLNKVRQDIVNKNEIRTSNFKNNKQDKTFDCYKIFLKKLEKELNYSEFHIKNNSILMIIKVNNTKEYIDIIKYVEGIKQFEIIDLDEAKKYGDNYIFSLSVQVKDI